MTRVVLHVPDISCEHCERVIKEALGRTAGVRAVEVDVPARLSVPDLGIAAGMCGRCRAPLR